MIQFLYPMKIKTTITVFFQKYTTFLDRLFLSFVALGLLLTGLLFSLNTFDFHFTMVSFFPDHLPKISLLQGAFTFLLGFIFLFYGLYIRFESPRSSTFLWGIGLFFWAAYINFVFANALQATPFPPIDHELIKIDQWMGINTPAIMAWTYNHPFFHRVFNFTYDFIAIELVAIPVTLALCNARRALGLFFIAQFFAFFIGCAIYYFFPTMAPSGVFNSPYFSPAQHDTSIRFFEVHHYLKVTASDGGLIAFPSFHVVWAILLTYACRGKKIFFYPVACFNLILIASTVFLGWHYFTDVIGGFVLAIGAIVFAEWAYKKS